MHRVLVTIDQTLHQFLTLLLIWTLLPSLTFYLITRSFQRTFAMGAAYQQRTLTPRQLVLSNFGTWFGLMLWPISPEFVMSPDFWVSNISRYFCFTFIESLYHCNFLYNIELDIDYQLNYPVIIEIFTFYNQLPTNDSYRVNILCWW